MATEPIVQDSSRAPGRPAGRRSGGRTALGVLAVVALLAGLAVSPLVLPHVLWRGLDGPWKTDEWRGALWLSAGLWTLAAAIAWGAARRLAGRLAALAGALALLVALWAAVESAYHVPYYGGYFRGLATTELPPDPLYEPLGSGVPSYRLQPGARMRMPPETPGDPKVEGIVDGWGMRSRTGGTPVLADDELRLLFVGDSVTFGPRVPFEATFPARTAALVGARLGRPVAPLNAGVPGYNFPELAGVAALLPWDEVRPDRVVLAICLNDNDGAETRYDPTTRALVPRHHRSYVLHWVEGLVTASATPDEQLRRAVQRLGRGGHPPIVALLPSVPLLTGEPAAVAERDRATQTLVRAAAAAAAAESPERWPLVDLTAVDWPPPLGQWFLTRADGNLDPYHFTAAGSERVAEHLAPAVAEALATDAPGR